MTPKVKGFLAIFAVIVVLSWIGVPIASDILEMLKNLFDSLRTVGAKP